MKNLQLLTTQRANETVHIAEDDMIHIMWRHITLRINVTGFIYLVDFLKGEDRRTIGFEAYGTPDDGYQIWIQDAGLRLSTQDCMRFTQLLEDGLNALRQMGKSGKAAHLPDCLKLTVPVEQFSSISHN